MPAPVQAAALRQLFIPKVPSAAASLHCCTASSSCQMFHELTEPAFSCRKCPEELAVYLSLHLTASRPPPQGRDNGERPTCQIADSKQPADSS